MARQGFANPFNEIGEILDMGAVFTSLGRTVVAGVVVLIIIIVGLHVTGAKMFTIDQSYSLLVMRWLHILSGVMWIGLLWYLNFVQVPTMPTIQPVESRTAITKFIAPNVLFYFRYAALATVVTGLLLAWMQHFLVEALTFHKGFIMIGTGMWI